MQIFLQLQYGIIIKTLKKSNHTYGTSRCVIDFMNDKKLFINCVKNYKLFFGLYIVVENTYWYTLVITIIYDNPCIFFKP